jgi:hypothetical protein
MNREDFVRLGPGPLHSQARASCRDYSGVRSNTLARPPAPASCRLVRQEALTADEAGKEVSPEVGRDPRQSILLVHVQAGPNLPPDFGRLFEDRETLASLDGQFYESDTTVGFAVPTPDPAVLFQDADHAHDRGEAGFQVGAQLGNRQVSGVSVVEPSQRVEPGHGQAECFVTGGQRGKVTA